MPAPALSMQTSQYIGEARSNYDRYVKLRQGGDWQWAGVLLFYSAVHLINACYSHYRPGRRFESHDDRNYYVRTSHPRPIRAHYMHLLRISQNLRYDLDRASAADLEDLHRDHYMAILDHMRDVHGIDFRGQGLEEQADDE